MKICDLWMKMKMKRVASKVRRRMKPVHIIENEDETSRPESGAMKTNLIFI